MRMERGMFERILPYQLPSSLATQGDLRVSHPARGLCIPLKTSLVPAVLQEQEVGCSPRYLYPATRPLHSEEPSLILPLPVDEPDP
jgi:hypothetical protein